MNAADADADKPGLFEVQNHDWIGGLDALQTAKPKTLVDGIRIRDIKVAVGANTRTRILSCSEAGDRGEPYRDLADRA